MAYFLNFKYKFRLAPYSSFVKGLTRHNSHDFCIYDESDSDLGELDVHFLSSPHIDCLSNEAEIISKLKGLLMMINGALSVDYNFERFERFGPLTITASEGISFSLVEKIDSLDVAQLSPFDPSNVYEEINDAPIYSRLVNAASKKHEVRVILGMCSLQHDWVNLYRIWDTLTYFTTEEFKKDPSFLPSVTKKKYQGKDLMAALCNTTLQEVSSFTGTANSFELLGLSSRHGILSAGSGNTQQGMTRTDAMKLVRTGCVNYLKKVGAL